MTEHPCGYHWSTRGGVLGSNHMCVKAQHSASELHECGSCDARCAAHDEEPRPLTETINPSDEE